MANKLFWFCHFLYMWRRFHASFVFYGRAFYIVFICLKNHNFVFFSTLNSFFLKETCCHPKSLLFKSNQIAIVIIKNNPFDIVGFFIRSFKTAAFIFSSFNHIEHMLNSVDVIIVTVAHFFKKNLRWFD